MIIAGEFNFTTSDTFTTHMSTQGQVGRHPQEAQRSEWLPILGLATDENTRLAFCTADDGSTTASASALDRFYMPIPQILLPWYNDTTRSRRHTT